MTTMNGVLGDLYDAAILTVGAIAISFVSRKLTKDSLGVPSTAMGLAKLSLALGLSATAIRYLEDKKYLPNNPYMNKPKSTVVSNSSS